MFNLNQHVALITGGNSGIGLAFARGLLKCGARVIIWGRSQEKNQRAVEMLEDLGSEVVAFACDVTDEKAIAQAFAASAEHFGHIDSCFANAGGTGPSGPLVKLEIEDWSNTMALNLDSVVLVYQQMIAHLMQRNSPGKLIVTSSEAALIGTGYASAYGTSKAAVMGLTRAMAVELGPLQITANAVLPGYIETEFVKNTSDTFKQSALRRSCLGRVGNAEDMEGVAVFLASTHSDYITGQGIVMDGGHSINPM